jgi:HTH-type transcriptional regulator/antitoxin HigA
VIIEPKIIKTEKQYRAYLAEVDRLAADDPVFGTPAGDRLELLGKLVEDYEKERFAFARPDPIAAIRFCMEERGLRQKDLAPMLGGKNRVSEVLAGKRPLTLAMVEDVYARRSYAAGFGEQIAIGICFGQRRHVRILSPAAPFREHDE